MFIGIDLGTSSVKSILLDANDRVIATASAPLEVSRPQPTFSEQNPEDWWQATIKATRAVWRVCIDQRDYLPAGRPTTHS